MPRFQIILPAQFTFTLEANSLPEITEDAVRGHLNRITQDGQIPLALCADQTIFFEEFTASSPEDYDELLDGPLV